MKKILNYMSDIKVPTRKEIEKSYNESGVDNIDAFKAGVDFIIEYQKGVILRKTTCLGFEIDIKKIHDLVKYEENVDELYSIQSGIKFINVDESNRELVIHFEVHDYAIFKGNYIKIDDKARVNVFFDDSPWEGGGCEGEMEEIVMKYVTQQKYSD